MTKHDWAAEPLERCSPYGNNLLTCSFFRILSDVCVRWYFEAKQDNPPGMEQGKSALLPICGRP